MISGIFEGIIGGLLQGVVGWMSVFSGSSGEDVGSDDVVSYEDYDE